MSLKRRTIDSEEQLPQTKKTRREDYAANVLEQFSAEIDEFHILMRPTDEEIQARELLRLAILRVIKDELPPNTKLLTLGSFATNSFLPTSNLDLCVKATKSHRSTISAEQLVPRIAHRLRESGIAKKVVTFPAKVTLFQIETHLCSIEVKINIGASKGMRSVPVYTQLVESLPALLPILLVLKTLTKSCNLDNEELGGLSTTSLFCLVARFLQEHQDGDQSLGALLLDLLYWYAFLYDWYNQGLYVTNGGGHFFKAERATKFHAPVAIQEPLATNHNVSIRTQRVEEIRSTFGRAYNTILHAMSLRADGSDPSSNILSTIIYVDPEIIAQRERVITALHNGEFERLRQVPLNNIRPFVPQRKQKGPAITLPLSALSKPVVLPPTLPRPPILTAPPHLPSRPLTITPSIPGAMTSWPVGMSGDLSSGFQPQVFPDINPK